MEIERSWLYRLDWLWEGKTEMRYINPIIVRLRSLLFLGLLLLSGIVVANPIVGGKTLPFKFGDYLSIEYIDLLMRTRSPIASAEQSDQRRYCNVKFDATDNKIYFGIGNFHDSEALYVTDSNLRYVAKIFGEFPVDLNIILPTEFSIKFDSKEIHYRYVGKLKQFVARNTVAGKYKDNNGKLYTFSDDGQAIFPDRKFRYEVPTDLAVDFDQFYEIPSREEGVKYGFKVVDTGLQLFKIVGEFVDKPEANPFLTLTRIGNETVSP